MMISMILLVVNNSYQYLAPVDLMGRITDWCVTEIISDFILHSSFCYVTIG